jgi:hypothetical protein
MINRCKLIYIVSPQTVLTKVWNKYTRITGERERERERKKKKKKNPKTRVKW